jgi:hypothetical protein
MKPRLSAKSARSNWKSLLKNVLISARIKFPKPLIPSIIFLILADVFPVFGILFWGWDLFPLMTLIWLENLVVMLFTIAKMLVSSPGNRVNWWKKLYLIPLFCLQYTFYMLLCGVVIFFLFRGNYQPDATFPDIPVIFQVFKDYQLVWGVLALLISHGVSFYQNYLGKAEYKKSAPDELMFEQFCRIAILQAVLLLAGYLVEKMGSITIALIFLFLLKTYLDIGAHVRQHKKYDRIITIQTV